MYSFIHIGIGISFKVSCSLVQQEENAFHTEANGYTIMSKNLSTVSSVIFTMQVNVILVPSGVRALMVAIPIDRLDPSTSVVAMHVLLLPIITT